MTQLSMAEAAKCEAFANDIMGDPHAPKMASPMTARLGDVFKELRTRSVPWKDIFAAINAIIAILQGGNDWAAVLSAVLALFGQGGATT